MCTIMKHIYSINKIHTAIDTVYKTSVYIATIHTSVANKVHTKSIYWSFKARLAEA